MLEEEEDNRIIRREARGRGIGYSRREKVVVLWRYTVHSRVRVIGDIRYWLTF